MGDKALLNPAIFQPESFRGKFQVSSFLDRLAGLVLDEADLKKRLSGKTSNVQRTQSSVQESVALVQQLLQQFERADKDLVALQQQVSQELHAARKEVEVEQENFQMHVNDLEGSFQEVTAAFSTLDQQMSHVSQTAAKVGNRLQAAEAFRQRALAAVDSINYLHEFANISDFRNLSDLFQDNDCLAEAAAVARQVQALGTGLIAAKERARQSTDADPPNRRQDPIRKGSIEHAVLQVESYRNVLENRVVSRFDTAAAAGDLSAMAQCARIMSQFRRGDAILMQRYISTRPMFVDVKQLQDGSPRGRLGTDQGEPLSGMASLAALYKSLLAAFKEEALVLGHVFPSSAPALTLFVQRVFEQKVQAGLDAVLKPGPAPDASAEVLQKHLQLLQEAFKRTLSLADSLQEVVGEATKISTFVDVVFSEHLAAYPALELRWLQRLYLQRNIQGLGAGVLAPLFAWNTEAVQRCVLLSGSSAPENVRQLFHSSTAETANLGCLLEQVATQVIGGLARTASGLATTATPYGSAQIGTLSRSAISKAASTVAKEVVGRVLETVAQATAAIQALQGQYMRVIVPQIQAQASEIAACQAGIAALIRAVEENVLGLTRSSLQALFSLVEQVLQTEQRKTDFRAGEADGTASLDRPTDACRLVTALLQAVLRVAAEFLQGSNLASFNAEVGSRAHAALLVHMQRFTYSATGALRWKRDLQEYAEAVQAAACPAVDAKMEELSGLANMLIVAPDSLVGLVEGSLRISHRQALLFIRLRDDFKTAKVEGTPLSALFMQD